jgi:large subunit ribosomal protein L25
MEKFKLKLDVREESSKPNKLRREGKIPGTLYGPGVSSDSIQVDAREFSRLPVAAYSHIVELQTAKGPTAALIRNVQREHTTNRVLNIEFYRVASDRKVTVAVPLSFVGASAAVQAGGVLQENYTTADIECFPGDIPDNIEVDISNIKELDHALHFSELKLPKGVVILNPHEEVVCRVVSPKGGVAAAATDAAPAAAGAAS